MIEACETTAGNGRFKLRSVTVRTMNGTHIYLGGGEFPHIGTVVVCQPRPSLTGKGRLSCTTSVFNLLGHKDDGIAVPIAEELCKSLGQVVVVTAGIHIDNAGPDDIAQLRKSGREILRLLRQHLVGSGQPKKQTAVNSDAGVLARQ